MEVVFIFLSTLLMVVSGFDYFKGSKRFNGLMEQMKAINEDRQKLNDEIRAVHTDVKNHLKEIQDAGHY
jgi:predicted  nucleic acid-binding Zn-ribbon protein